MPSRSQLKAANKPNTNNQSFDLGPHPADPHTAVMPAAMKASQSNGSYIGPQAQEVRQEAQEIYVYGGDGGYVFPLGPFFVSIDSSSQNFHLLALLAPYSTWTSGDGHNLQHKSRTATPLFCSWQRSTVQMGEHLRKSLLRYDACHSYLSHVSVMGSHRV